MTPGRQWFYHGTSGKRWESIQMHSAFAILPIYLTTDRRRAEHYAKARAASDGDTQYALIGLCLLPDVIEKDNYSDNEPDQFICRKPIHQNTFYSQYLRVEVFPMPTDEEELCRLEAFCVGMGYGDERHPAPGFKHLLQEVKE